MGQIPVRRGRHGAPWVPAGGEGGTPPGGVLLNLPGPILMKAGKVNSDDRRLKMFFNSKIL